MAVDISAMSVAERIQLVEDIWDSVATTPDEVAVTAVQRDELERRLQAYAGNPTEGKTWQQVKDALEQRSAQ